MFHRAHRTDRRIELGEVAGLRETFTGFPVTHPRASHRQKPKTKKRSSDSFEGQVVCFLVVFRASCFSPGWLFGLSYARLLAAFVAFASSVAPVDRAVVQGRPNPKPTISGWPTLACCGA